MTARTWIAIAFCGASGLACTVEAPSPGVSLSLAVVNAKVWTGDSTRPLVDALGVSDTRIAALGSGQAIRELTSTGQLIDAGGAMVVPGFIDTHAHIIDAGHRLLNGQPLAPPGIADDDAARLVANLRSGLSPAADDAALLAALEHLAAQGVTSVHHMGTWDDVATLRRAADDGRLTVRTYAAVPLSTWERLADAIATGAFGGSDGRGDDWLRVGAVKGFVDGSLGSHTAAFDQPYVDAPENRGRLLHDPDRLYRWIAAADRAGLQVAMHAVGDRANHLVLNTFERVARENGPWDRRFRIEHAQHLRPPDVERFARLGVIASMQPYRVIEIGGWAETLIGPERARTSFAVRSLLDSGARVTFSSDWFLAPVAPLVGLYAAVTRRPLDGTRRGGWVPAQQVTIAQALDAYTVTGAYASFEERRKGQLAIGQLADFVVVDADLLSVPSPDIRFASVLLTVVGGRIVFDRRTSQQADANAPVETR